jgi:hypothetical protein
MEARLKNNRKEKCCVSLKENFVYLLNIINNITYNYLQVFLKSKFVFFFTSQWQSLGYLNLLWTTLRPQLLWLLLVMRSKPQRLNRSLNFAASLELMAKTQSFSLFLTRHQQESEVEEQHLMH